MSSRHDQPRIQIVLYVVLVVALSAPLVGADPAPADLGLPPPDPKALEENRAYIETLKKLRTLDERRLGILDSMSSKLDSEDVDRRAEVLLRRANILLGLEEIDNMLTEAVSYSAILKEESSTEPSHQNPVKIKYHNPMKYGTARTVLKSIDRKSVV